MNTKTISTPDFMGSTAKIIAEISTRTSIDDVDVEVLKGILQEYYEEELSSARSKAYDDGHSDGYEYGYDIGYADGRSESRLNKGV